MILDIQKVMLLYVLANIISVGLVVFLLRRRRWPRFTGITFWMVNMALQCVGAMIIFYRGMVPDFYSILLSNAFIMSGITLIAYKTGVFHL